MRRILPFVALALPLFAGCQQAGRRIVEAQTPGGASGAGASLTGPANSAAPSSQVAERTIAFQVPLPSPAVPIIHVPAPAAAAGAPALPSAPPPPPAPAPAWMYERTQTTLGQHQDAAGIVKVAVAMNQWGAVKWIGLVCCLLGLGGILWSYKNEESGYPLVYIKILGAGVFLLLIGDNPLWLFVLLIPLGLYAVQKFNLLRIP